MATRGPEPLTLLLPFPMFGSTCIVLVRSYYAILVLDRFASPEELIRYRSRSICRS